MTAKGCTFNGGVCHTVVEKCAACDHEIDFNGERYCRTYPDPASKWLLGKCNFATNIVKEEVKETKQVNPLKESKRRSKGM